jgi:hypothetical protein
MQHVILKRLVVPGGCLMVVLILTMVVDDMLLQDSAPVVRRTIAIARYALGIGLWLTVAWLAMRTLDELVWPLRVEHRVGHPLPRL